MSFELPDEPLQWVADLEVPSWDAWFMSLVFVASRRSNDRQTKQGAVIVDWPTKSILGLGYNGHPRKAIPPIGKLEIPVFRKDSAKFRLVGNDGVVYQRGATVPETVNPVRYFMKTGYESEYTAFEVPYSERSFRRDDIIQGVTDKYPYMCHCETNALISCTGSSQDAVLYIPMPSCEACGGLVLNHPHIKVKRIVYYEDRNFRNLIYQVRPDVKVEKFDLSKGNPADLLQEVSTYIRLRDRDSHELSKNSAVQYK